jgi:hypothetical protein
MLGKEDEGKSSRASKKNKGVSKSDEISRRGFLKSLGIGVALAGAYAVIPSAEAFSISSDNPIDFYNSTSQSSNLQIGSSGDIDLKYSNLVNAKNVETEEVDFSDNTDTNRRSIRYDKELDTLVVIDRG